MCVCVRACVHMQSGYKLFILQSFAHTFTAKVIVRYCERSLILIVVTSMIRTNGKQG